MRVQNKSSENIQYRRGVTASLLQLSPRPQYRCSMLPPSSTRKAYIVVFPYSLKVLDDASHVICPCCVDMSKGVRDLALSLNDANSSQKDSAMRGEHLDCLTLFQRPGRGLPSRELPMLCCSFGRAPGAEFDMNDAPDVANPRNIAGVPKHAASCRLTTSSKASSPCIAPIPT